jgi:hypothetical protein
LPRGRNQRRGRGREENESKKNFRGNEIKPDQKHETDNQDSECESWYRRWFSEMHRP